MNEEPATVLVLYPALTHSHSGDPTMSGYHAANPDPIRGQATIGLGVRQFRFFWAYGVNSNCIYLYTIG